MLHHQRQILDDIHYEIAMRYQKLEDMELITNIKRILVTDIERIL